MPIVGENPHIMDKRQLVGTTTVVRESANSLGKVTDLAIPVDTTTMLQVKSNGCYSTLHDPVRVSGRNFLSPKQSFTLLHLKKAI